VSRCRHLGNAGEAAVHLLSRLLAFDPARRCSAEEALTHEYLHSFEAIDTQMGQPAYFSTFIMTDPGSHCGTEFDYCLHCINQTGYAADLSATQQIISRHAVLCHATFNCAVLCCAGQGWAGLLTAARFISSVVC